MKDAIGVLLFCLRHVLLIGAAVVVFSILWTVVYFVLLVYAVVANGGLGGPLAYPTGLIVVVFGTVMVGLGIFAPACGLGALCCRVFGWRKFAAIPVVVFGALLLFWLGLYAMSELSFEHAVPEFSKVVTAFSIFLAVPLGIYWWLSEGMMVILGFLRRRFIPHPSPAP